MTHDALLGGEISPDEIAQLMQTPGGRIRFMRLTRQMKQSTLAEKVHTTQASISLYETGARRPGPLMQRALAEALDTTREFLFGTAMDRAVA